MAVEHSRDEANTALDNRATRQQAAAQALVEAAQLPPGEADRLEEERQAAYRYFLATGKDINDLEVDDQEQDITEEEAQEIYAHGAGASLQSRLDQLQGLVVEEAATAWTRGGTVVIRWGIMQDDDSEDYTLGVSVAYNDQEPADVYLAVTQQRLNEWRSLQGKDGEKRFTAGLVQHLIGLTGEDIAVEIASALGELVSDGQTSIDGPTETAIGPDHDGDDALTTEDAS